MVFGLILVFGLAVLSARGLKDFSWTETASRFVQFLLLLFVFFGFDCVEFAVRDRNRSLLHVFINFPSFTGRYVMRIVLELDFKRVNGRFLRHFIFTLNLTDL